MLFCVIGPSLPGLSMRTITTTFIGCCWVAVAAESAPWLVFEVVVGPGGSAGAAVGDCQPSGAWTDCDPAAGDAAVGEAAVAAVSGEVAASVSHGSAAWAGCDPATGTEGAAVGAAEPSAGAAKGISEAIAATAPPAADATGGGAATCGLGAASAAGAKTPQPVHAIRTAAPRCHANPPAKNSEQNLDFKAELL
jgi:hypothetical protein